MSKIFKNQSLKLTLNTGQDCSTASIKKVKYIKPDGTTGDEDAQISDTTYLYYQFPINTLDQSGDWRFWTFITLSDGSSAPGEVVKIRIYDEGE